MCLWYCKHVFTGSGNWLVWLLLGKESVWHICWTNSGNFENTLSCCWCASSSTLLWILLNTFIASFLKVSKSFSSQYSNSVAKQLQIAVLVLHCLVPQKQVTMVSNCENWSIICRASWYIVCRASTITGYSLWWSEVWGFADAIPSGVWFEKVVFVYQKLSYSIPHNSQLCKPVSPNIVNDQLTAVMQFQNYIFEISNWLNRNKAEQHAKLLFVSLSVSGTNIPANPSVKSWCYHQWGTYI